MKRFKPPSIQNPPALVAIEWLDAQMDSEFDGAIEEAGSLVVLPTAGYHVRNGRSPEGVPFIVLAREYSISTGAQTKGQTMARDIITIPTGWIRRWSVATSFTQTYPPEDK